MYNRIVFETPKELFDACRSARPEGDNSPQLPHSVYLVFDGNCNPKLSGEGSDKFEIEGMSQEDLIRVAFARLGIKVHFT